MDSEDLTEFTEVFNALEDEKSELLNLLLDVFKMECWVAKKEKFDHMCSHTYQEVQDTLIRYKRINKRDCVRK